ncbi:SIP domain-containing protein [Paraferrimonas sp. SM1919]|uniref:SIP domain-containing protein n=1 Tax=Paraferrimonas sp. SM1919 TaxID=2662263 RepID=UPI0013D5C73E|nr:SIP domain-containing protein [Paraferrimonas sp. SM1919]
MKNFNEASYLLIGDLTSINAVAAYAKRVGAAKTKVIIDTPDSINAAMVKQHWPSHFEVIDSSTGTDALDKALINAVNSLNTKPQVFMGVEASVNKRLLKRLTQELNIPKSNISASPYWKQGVNANQLMLLKKLGAA